MAGSLRHSSCTLCHYPGAVARATAPPPQPQETVVIGVNLLKPSLLRGRLRRPPRVPGDPASAARTSRRFAAGLDCACPRCQSVRCIVLDSRRRKREHIRRRVILCQRCGTQGSSTLEKGYSLGDSRIYRDQGWNFGYGHYIIVRYLSELLPESTRAELTNRGFGGAHLFVMTAHLQDMLVQVGQDLQPNQQIATMGNSDLFFLPPIH